MSTGEKGRVYLTVDKNKSLRCLVVHPCLAREKGFCHVVRPAVVLFVNITIHNFVRGVAYFLPMAVFLLLRVHLGARILMMQVLHGDITQAQRDITIKQFRNKQFQVLVATDVAARGIDVSDIDLVVQYRPPLDSGKSSEGQLLPHERHMSNFEFLFQSISNRSYQHVGWSSVRGLWVSMLSRSRCRLLGRISYESDTRAHTHTQRYRTSHFN